MPYEICAGFLSLKKCTPEHSPILHVERWEVQGHRIKDWSCLILIYGQNDFVFFFSKWHQLVSPDGEITWPHSDRKNLDS